MLRSAGRTVVVIAAVGVFAGVLAGLTVIGWALDRKDRRR